jgi:hypothetical protein
MLVSLDAKTDFPRLLVLESFDFVRTELEDRAAAAADEMIVMSAIELALEASFPLENEGLSEAGAFQKLECPVDRGSTDAGGLLPDKVVEIVDGQMLVRGEERTDHKIPARASIQTSKLQVSFENAGFIRKYSLH